VSAPASAPTFVESKEAELLGGEITDEDDEYYEEEDRDRDNTPYLNVRDVVKVTLTSTAANLVALAKAPRGQAKEFKRVKKIQAFLDKTTARAEEEAKANVSYTPEEDHHFYVTSEVEIIDHDDPNDPRPPAPNEIEIGLHKDGTEDEFKFMKKMTIPTHYIDWVIVERADQSVDVTEGEEDDRWRAVLDCLHTYGGDGHPFGDPLVDTDGEPLLDERDMQRYNDIENIAAIEGVKGVKGVKELLKLEATTLRKVYIDALKDAGTTWKAIRATDGVIEVGDATVELHDYTPPPELDDVRQKWLNALSMSSGPTNDGDEPKYVFDPRWAPHDGGETKRTEEEKTHDAQQIHIRSWALHTGMRQMPAIEYKTVKSTGLPKIEYDNDDNSPRRIVKTPGRQIQIQWGEDWYDAIVVENNPDVDPPLLRCEYTRPFVQVSGWTVTKRHHGNEFRYIVDGPESQGESKEDRFQIGELETLERVQAFFNTRQLSDELTDRKSVV
jgi:hypothetical protein